MLCYTYIHMGTNHTFKNDYTFSYKYNDNIYYELFF